MKVYLTKYGLTDGILEMDMYLHEDKDTGKERLIGKDTAIEIPSRNIYDDFEAAVKRVEEMRDLRIASLEKQIVNLRNLDCSKLAKGE